MRGKAGGRRSPHQRAVKAFADRQEMLEKNARDWRRVAFAAVALSVVLAGAYYSLATRSTTVPYIVQVNEHGYAVPVRPAEQLSVRDHRIVIAFLSEFFRDHRSFTTDEMAQRESLSRVFNAIAEGSEAELRAREHYSFIAESDFRHGEGVRCRVKHVLSRGGNTWQVDFEEEHFGSHSRALKVFSAIVEIEIKEDQSMERVTHNPLGIYVVGLEIGEERRG